MAWVIKRLFIDEEDEREHYLDIHGNIWTHLLKKIKTFDNRDIAADFCNGYLEHDEFILAEIPDDIMAKSLLISR